MKKMIKKICVLTVVLCTFLGTSAFAKEKTEKVPEKTTEKTTETILKQIQANPNITTQELAEKFGMTTDGIFYHIKKLKLQHRIVREGGRKNGHWIVNE